MSPNRAPPAEIRSRPRATRPSTASAFRMPFACALGAALRRISRAAGWTPRCRYGRPIALDPISRNGGHLAINRVATRDASARMVLAAVLEAAAGAAAARAGFVLRARRSPDGSVVTVRRWLEELVIMVPGGSVELLALALRWREGPGCSDPGARIGRR